MILSKYFPFTERIFDIERKKILNGKLQKKSN